MDVRRSQRVKKGKKTPSGTVTTQSPLLVSEDRHEGPKVPSEPLRMEAEDTHTIDDEAKEDENYVVKIETAEEYEEQVDDDFDEEMKVDIKEEDLHFEEDSYLTRYQIPHTKKENDPDAVHTQEQGEPHPDSAEHLRQDPTPQHSHRWHEMPRRRTTPMPTQGPQASQDSQDTQPAEPEERSEPAEELLPEVSLSNIEHQDIAGLSDTVQPKKRYRLSKKEISDYKFTQEQKGQIAEFVKEHPTLYDKRDKQWSNPRAKEELWRELAREFENCTFHQIRKYFEARRTDFGKIEKENKSGAAARQRTTREEEVMSMWGFLGGHISHEPTIPSEQFSPAPDGATPTMEIGGESSSGDMSGLSVTSIQRRKRLLKQRRTERGERRVGT
ncbi:uncharacterized protein LOC127007187 [Eriocheir sinensis]|uniref:uncharacterized protein LOC127007187 n=1 Tax=Eriocheir sinensis TaxID=95602 RepID=UPI0021C73849|nr:uncharacterized protein LOC127007187 [Eriocheir sinensis]